MIETISEKVNPQAGAIIQAILSESRVTQRAAKSKFTGFYFLKYMNH